MFNYKPYKFIKSLFIKKIILYLILFLSADIFYSNLIYKDNLKYNCYKYLDNFHKLQKNCKAKEKWVRKAKAYDVYTDKNSFRFSGKKTNFDIKKKNLFFMGDSFTYGMGLEYSKTYVGMIEKKLIHFNTFNLGVPGYSPSVYLPQLKDVVINKKIMPNKIFMTLDISDVAEEASLWISKKDLGYPVTRKNNFAAPEENKIETLKDKNFKASRFIARSVNNFFRNIKISYSNKYIKRSLKANSSNLGEFIHTEIDQTNKDLWKPLGFEKALEKMEDKIVKISSYSKKINSEFYIIIYPWPDTLEFGQKNFNWENYAKNLCKVSNCKKVISIFPEFMSIKKNSKTWLYDLYIDGDIHITEKGNKIITTKIIKESF